MPVSVVIPAHDEEAVLPRCLSALLDGAEPGELDVVVVCNGCTDGTARVAREFGRGVRVVETPVAAKWWALVLGDAASRSFPRFYVDADVVLSLESVRRMAARLSSDALAAAPTMDPDLSGASWGVRAFYDVWTRLPYTREGMIGVGVYALSEKGRSRFSRFPDVVADDGYVRAHFDRTERVRVEDATVRVTPPATLSALVRVKARSRLGGYQLRRLYPWLMERENRAKDYRGAWRVLARDPKRWPAAAVYVGVNACARVLAHVQRLRGGEGGVWERDETSRRPAARTEVRADAPVLAPPPELFAREREDDVAPALPQIAAKPCERREPMRSMLRSVLYSAPLVRVTDWAKEKIAPRPPESARVWWDQALTGRLTPYLGGTLANDVRNAVTVELLRHHAPRARTLLDVGCAGGSLARPATAAGFTRYVGVDVSTVAVSQIDPALGSGCAADLREFEPVRHGPFDVIVFNEVLYYTGVHESLGQIERYAAALTEDGVFVVGMKDDPKSRAIFGLARRRLDWLTGILVQEQPDSPCYSVRADRARPAYLIGLLRPRVFAGTRRPTIVVEQAQAIA